MATAFMRKAQAIHRAKKRKAKGRKVSWKASMKEAGRKMKRNPGATVNAPKRRKKRKARKGKTLTQRVAYLERKLKKK